MNKLLSGPSLAFWLAVLVANPAAAAGWVGSDFNGAPCTGKPTGYGPFDYLQRAFLQEKLSIVERFHFTPEVENLVRGKSGYIWGDLDYTLRAWPNHHRALNAMIRFQEHLDKTEIRRLKASEVPPVECYLQRAIAFSPRDATSRMLFAIFLHRKGQMAKARKVYEGAIQLAPQDLQLQYNYGLLLVDLGELERAREVAKLVYAQDFPLPGLRRKLKSASSP